MEPEIHPRMVGSDRFIRKGGKILVYTRIEMPDWQVRKYRRAAIVIDDRTYFVSKKERIEGSSIRYVLELWPENFRDMPGKTICYDEDYVRERDRSLSETRRRERGAQLLRPLKPLIGLLPSSTKRRIETRYGLSARSATFFSLWLELIAFFAFGTMTWILAYVTLRGAAISGAVSAPLLLGILALAGLLIVIDMVIRYSDYLSECDSPYGFFEWLFGRRRG